MCELDEENRGILKPEGLLTRDPRMVERKKFGQKKARKKFQFSKHGRNNASLNEICKIYGFPGKLDMDGGKVWETFLNGDLASIRNYCETDVANTYLVYLRYLLAKNELTTSAYKNEIDNFRHVISNYKKSHWSNFLKAWA